MTISEYLAILAVLFWVRGTSEKTANVMSLVAAVFAVTALFLEKIAP